MEIRFYSSNFRSKPGFAGFFNSFPTHIGKILLKKRHESRESTKNIRLLLKSCGFDNESCIKLWICQYKKETQPVFSWLVEHDAKFRPNNTKLDLINEINQTGGTK